MASDLRLARLLTRGADRLERRRTTLTALGAAVATGFALAATGLASVQGQVWFPYGHGLLDQPGTRKGVVAGLLLLLIPVLAFLGQCARIGAVHRDRRLAALRLSGAGPRQVRRIAALEAGLACLVGAVAGLLVFLALLAVVGRRPPPLAWPGFALVVLLIPVLAVLVSRVALRRVIASPLGHVRRMRPGRGPGLLLGLWLPALLVVTGASLIMARGARSGYGALPLFVIGAVVLTGAGAIRVAGTSARAIGRRLADRTERPAVLLAAHRLQQDPWATSRSHATVVLVTVVGVATTGIGRVLVTELRATRQHGSTAEPIGYYAFGLGLTGAAILVGLAIALAALAVGTAESLSARRSALAVQAAAGVPRKVLARALLLETALPLAPALVLATLGGTAIHAAYGLAVGQSVPWALPLLVPALVYAACLLATTTALPLLHRSANPAELRFA
ncbi:ABC transporter permease [Streptomyces endophyticus]|uniref:ABC transporter permease n=1 Tax=Streptomyces endophyticus TaxID=714166 RepID=A0ABU6FHG2_9ACTN|nr:ABC transporter permease [Streptomyces endophyticus]